MATLLRLGWATALRLGDLLTLKWNEVAVAADGSVIVEKVQSKVQKKVRLVLAAGSGRWLLSLPREDDGFVAPLKLRKMRKQNLVKAFGALLLKVGIAPNVAVKGLRNRVRKYGFHSLRHGAATHMAGLSASAPTISAALGHNSLTMTQRYLAHSSPQQDALMSKAAPDIELLNEHQESQP
jgi:integrase